MKQEMFLPFENDPRLNHFFRSIQDPSILYNILKSDDLSRHSFSLYSFAQILSSKHKQADTIMKSFLACNIIMKRIHGAKEVYDLHFLLADQNISEELLNLSKGINDAMRSLTNINNVLLIFGTLSTGDLHDLQNGDVKKLILIEGRKRNSDLKNSQKHLQPLEELLLETERSLFQAQLKNSLKSELDRLKKTIDLCGKKIFPLKNEVAQLKRTCEGFSHLKQVMEADKLQMEVTQTVIHDLAQPYREFQLREVERIRSYTKEAEAIFNRVKV